MTGKVFLIGLPGSGKSTFAKRLASELDLPFIDLDDEIVSSTSSSISEIFEKKGEDHFRELERDELRKVTLENDQFILAAGGGTPCFFDNMDFMNEQGTTIYINTSLGEIKKRLAQDQLRPLMKKYDIEELLEKRKPWYEQAHHMVSDFVQVRNIFIKK